MGFFDKARQADLLVLLDSVQYRKNYFQNRNRVRASNGPAWVTVPVLTKGSSSQTIREVRINDEGSPRWREKYWATIEQSYRGTPFWSEYAGPLHDALRTESALLAEVNQRFIEVLLRWFGIEVKIVRSSELPVDGSRTDLLLAVCQAVGADRYLSGISGREYLDVAKFTAANIAVEFHEFHHPIYAQRYEPFEPCMSSIDLLFNHGAESSNILKGIGVPVMAEVFA